MQVIIKLTYKIRRFPKIKIYEIVISRIGIYFFKIKIINNIKLSFVIVGKSKDKKLFP